MRGRSSGHLLAAACLGAAALALAGTAVAQGRFVEDVQISRSGGEARLVIRLACPMRFQADVPLEAGALLEVRVAPFEACRQLGGGAGIYSELFRPVGSQLAHLVEIEYESLGLGDSLLMLRFDRPVDYRVSQRADLRTLELMIALDEGAVVAQVQSPPQAASQPQVAAPPPSTSPRGERAPLTSRAVEPATVGDYMINLQSTLDPVDPERGRSVAVSQGLRLYVSQTTVDGQTWYRLRMGFFESEERARNALEGLQAQFPRAWIGRAEPEEIRLAREFTFGAGRDALPVVAADELAAAPDAALGSPAALTEERIAELLEEARNALLDEDFSTAIEIYRQVLRAPGEHRADAREYLGLAYERSGRSALARAEYESYMHEFPSAEGSSRVQQRLNGLVMATAAPPVALRSVSAPDAGRWDIASGFSQYYRRDINQFDADQAEITTLSAVLTDVDFNVNRRGDRLDFSTRLTLSHMYDLVGETANGPGDQERVSYAHFDLASTRNDWSLRLGRQSLYNWGVLGRFDGAHFAYGFGPDLELHVSTGYPVESTRDAVETDRQFHGLAVELDDLFGSWDVAAYLNAQTIEGIDARKAIGMELRYFDDRRSFTSMVDYDTDFAEINTALVLGTWQFPNHLTLSALIDSRKSPLLTTRNALIGQPVATIAEMLLVWTEEEIRELAFDRTADSDTVTLGIAKPLATRFQLNFDVTRAQIGATVASGGVTEIPGTGVQTFYSASIVGTGLFSAGDVNIINIRVGESSSFKTAYLTFDARFPIGQRIRINPRLRFAIWQGLLDGRERETVSPALRFLMNTRSHYRLEFEIGADEFTRTDSLGVHEGSGTFVNFGYRAIF